MRSCPVLLLLLLLAAAPACAQGNETDPPGSQTDAPDGTDTDPPVGPDTGRSRSVQVGLSGVALLVLLAVFVIVARR